MMDFFFKEDMGHHLLCLLSRSCSRAPRPLYTISNEAIPSELQKKAQKVGIRKFPSTEKTPLQKNRKKEKKTEATCCSLVNHESSNKPKKVVDGWGKNKKIIDEPKKRKPKGMRESHPLRKSLNKQKKKYFPSPSWSSSVRIFKKRKS